MVVELLGSDEVFELFQTRKRPVFKDLFRHVNPLEQIIELFRSASRVPGASEPWQMLANLLEGHAVAPIVLAGSSKTHTTVRKHLAHYLRNLAHAIVVRSIANIEYFIVNRLGGSLQHCDNRTRNGLADSRCSLSAWEARSTYLVNACPVHRRIIQLSYSLIFDFT